ncbi:MAG: TonB-dependent receptor [Bryobacteraceae bacterium]|nr:TonB-dependent receptor [Bryobacteraceae bacterium]
MILAVAAPLLAQTGNGVVSGTVLDASRAAIPGAKVTLTQTATGVARSVETTGVGIYYFGSVPIGPYRLEVESSGFKKWSGTLQVEAGQRVVIDPQMEVGTLEAVVEVTGAAPVIATEGMEIGDVKDAQRIRQLPLNGRLIANLFDLTPGVEGGGNPRVNGMKVGSADMLLDGISFMDRYGGGLRPVQPGLDTIQEFRVETTGSAAQYSRPATMTLVTKSGTNEIHSTAFWTHRNNFGGLRARQRQDFFDTPPQYIRNEFGISAGGPIVKNKTFWFVAYEGQRERQATFARAQAANDAIWGGDFSGAVDSDNVPITIYDPLTTAADGTRTPFAGNRIPSSRIAPIAATMKSVSAAPNAPGNPWLEPNFQTYYPRVADINTYTFKGDHVFSEKDNLSARYTDSHRPFALYGGRYGYPPPGSTNAGGTGAQDTTIRSAFARWNHVFSPTLLNEFQASANRAKNHTGTLADSTNWADQLGFPNPFGTTGWPTIYSESPFYYWGGWDADNPQDQNLTAFQLENNVTWIKGTHTVKFGFKGRQEYNNARELQQSQGSHYFGGEWTALYDPADEQRVSFTGNGFGSMLLGLPTYLSNQYNRGYFYFQQKEIGLYVQDSWKVSQRLTLDIGLRWDKWTVFKEKYDRLVNLDLQDYVGKMQVVTPHSTRMEDIPGIPGGVLASWGARGLTWTTADQAGFPGGLLPADNNNFAPRIGAAFRMSDKWVLRGGYGIYYWPMPLVQILASSRTNPPLNLRFQNSLDNANGRIDNYALSYAPSPNDFIGRAAVDVEGIAGISNRAQAMMPWDIHNWSDNMMQSFNVTFEREIMRETALRLSYIGNHGSNLEQRWRWNDPESEFNFQARTGLAANSSNPDPRRANPNWTSGCCNAPIRHNGFSNSHSVQAEVERRYSSGLAYQAFYTFSRVMTTTDTGGFNFGSSGINSSGSSSAYAVPENHLILGNPNLSESQRLRMGYANSVEVPAHRVRFNGIYSLPFGRGKKFGSGASGALNHVIGGWEIAFIGNWRGGNWMGVDASRYLFGDPTLDADQRLEMTYNGLRQRLWFRGYLDPTLARDVDQSALQALIPLDRSQRVLRPVGASFDNRVQVQLADGSVRNTSITDMLNWNARNFFRGPGAWNTDLSLFKNIYFTERLKTRITADFFNAFNHPLDLNPNAGTGLQDLSRQSNDPRIIQFSLRVEF